MMYRNINQSFRSVLKTIVQGATRSFVIPVVVCGLLIGQTEAASVTWTGASSATWSDGDATNWSATYNNGDDVTFNDSGSNTNVVLSGTITPGSTTFNNSIGYSLSGAALGGTGSVTQGGSGTTSFGVANTYTGKTFLNSGVLSINGAGRLGAAPGSVVTDQLTFNGGTLQSTSGGNVTINENRGITVNGGNGTFDIQSGNVIIEGNITGSGSLSKTGAGILTLSPPTNPTGAGGTSNDFVGPLTINEGIVRVSTVSTGIPLQGDPNPVAPGGFIVNSGASLQFSSFGNQTWVDPVTLNGGTMADLLSSNNFHSGDITLTANSTISKLIAAWGISGAIQGGFGFTKGGNALVRLTGNNTYTGHTIVEAGELEVNGSSSLGTNTALVVRNVNTGVGATVRLDLNSAANTFGSLSGTIATPSSGTNVATIDLPNSYAFTIEQSVDGLYEGIITGSGSSSFVLDGASTAALTLAGASTYGGGTTIDGGTLLASNSTGSATGTGPVAVNSGGTLGGNGSIDGLVTVNSGGTLEAGESTGTLTLDGGLLMQNGSVLNVEMEGNTPGAGGYDQIIVGGTATLAGTLSIEMLGDFLPSISDSFVVLTADNIVGTFDNEVSPDGFIKLGGFFAEISYDGNQVTLTSIQVPEPSSILLLGLGALGCVTLSRRRRRQEKLQS